MRSTRACLLLYPLYAAFSIAATLSWFLLPNCTLVKHFPAPNWLREYPSSANTIVPIYFVPVSSIFIRNVMASSDSEHAFISSPLNSHQLDVSQGHSGHSDGRPNELEEARTCNRRARNNGQRDSHDCQPDQPEQTSQPGTALGETLSKHDKQENCTELTVAKLNPEIWRRLSNFKKSTDIRLSNVK